MIQLLSLGSVPLFQNLGGGGQIEIPEGYRPVLLKYRDKMFVSADGRLQISLPTDKLEDTDHDFEKIYFEDEGYYFFFTIKELSGAGFDIARRPNFNYWNAKAIRWELGGHVLENDYDNIHRFYTILPGYYPICYRLQEDGTFKTQHQNFPVFTVNDFRNAECFKHLFADERHVLSHAFFFIEFTGEELQSFGVCIPKDETGFKFNPFLGQSEEVERPGSEYGWDFIFGEWVPFCQSCQPGCKKLDFCRFSLMLKEQNVCSVNVPSINFGSSTTNSYPSNPFERLFSSQGGPYCDRDCYCTHCFKVHDPSEKSEHAPYPDSEGWTCDRFPTDGWRHGM